MRSQEAPLASPRLLDPGAAVADPFRITAAVWAGDGGGWGGGSGNCGRACDHWHDLVLDPLAAVATFDCAGAGLSGGRTAQCPTVAGESGGRAGHRRAGAGQGGCKAAQRCAAAGQSSHGATGCCKALENKTPPQGSTGTKHEPAAPGYTGVSR